MTLYIHKWNWMMVNHGKQWHTCRRINSTTANKTANITNKPNIPHHHSTYTESNVMANGLWKYMNASKGPKSMSKDCLSTIKVLASASMLPLDPSEWFDSCRSYCFWVADVETTLMVAARGSFFNSARSPKNLALHKFSGKHEFGVELGQFPEIIKRQKVCFNLSINCMWMVGFS